MTTAISVTYTDSKLRILTEEYIAKQKKDFTFKSLCSYILYRAMEEEKTATNGLYDSNQLDSADCDRVSVIMDKIIREGLICEVEDKRYKKQ